MKTTQILVHRVTLLVVASLLAGGLQLRAQTAPAAASAAQISFVAPRITQAIDETQLTLLKGNVHPLARPQFDQGAVPDATPMNRMLLLLRRSPEQETALQDLLLQQQNTGTPGYHKWLTPAQFGAQFGPADADIQTITDWLTSNGFHDLKVAAGKVAIEFSGNVGQVRSAFHTDIHHFLVNGEMHQANVSDPQIPAALSPVVAGIVSLHNFPHKSMRRDAGTHTAKLVNGHVVPEFTGTNGQFYAVGPADFATIYGIPSTFTGANATIAIIGDSGVNLQDISDYRALFGVTPANNVTVVSNGPTPAINGEEGEADLDLQVSGAVAPSANINFIATEDTLTANGIDLGALFVVDNNSADVMSLSFGDCEAGLGTTGNALFNALWEQAAAQGISVTVSSGDNGSAACDNFNALGTPASGGLAVNGIASTPFNVAVGGTDFDDVGTQTTFWSATNAANTRESALGYIPETTWNDSCAAGATSSNLTTVCATVNNIIAGSGGPSSKYTKPPYQVGASTSDTARDLPDVSLFASDGPSSKSFYLVCQADAVPTGNPPSCAPSGSFSFQAVGGTSASAPAFAGILALIDQRVGGRQGNANFALYAIAKTASSSCSSSSRTVPTNPPSPAGCSFNDITKGNNSVPCTGGATKNCSAATNGVLVEPSSTTTPAWTTTAGYDLATGLGSVNVSNLAAAWKTAVTAFTGTTTTATVNGSATPPSIPHGSSVTLAATVTSGSGTPTGDVSFLTPTTVNGGIGDATLNGSGNATLSTTVLPGGTYNLKAHYTGGVSSAASFAPSDSAGIPVTVTPEASGLLFEIVTFDPVTGNIVSTNATTFAYGSPYILRMDILNHTGNATNCQPLANPAGVTTGCAFDATGSVTILDNGNPLPGSPFPLNSAGHAEDQPIQLGGGARTLSATYSGDISYNPSAAPPDNVTVTTAATTTAVSANQSTVQVGQQVTLSVTVSSQSNSTQGPTGNITFKDGTTTIGTPRATPAGASATAGAGATASLTTTFSAGGAHSITAVYPGDTNYATSTSTAITVNVTPVSISATPITVTAGSSGTSTVTVTPSGGFTGSVAITCSALPGVSCAALSINVTSASPATGTLSVSVTAPSSSMTAMVLPATQDQWAATAPPSSGPRGGWWIFSGLTGLAALLLLVLPGRRRYRLAFATLSTGCLLSFAIGCGGGYGGGGGGGGGGMVATSTAMTVSSTKVPSTGAGATITVSANVTDKTTGRAPSGNVQFFDGTTALGSPVPVTNGTTGQIALTAASAPAFYQLVGTHSVSAHYLGDAYTSASQSGTLNIAVTGTTQLALTGTSGTTTANTNVALTIN